MTARRREIVLQIAAALWGLAAGITLGTLTIREPHPDQLPGLMLARGLDSHGPLRSILFAIAALFVITMASKPVARHIANDANTRDWGVWAMAIALALGLDIAMVDPFQTIAILFAPPILAIVIAALSRRDIHLPRVPHRVRVWIYALIAIAWFFPRGGDPIVNLFEDGHSLMPAAAMTHGARPYADVVPGHGLIADGLLDYALMRTGAHDLGSILRRRTFITALLPAAVYFVALAATGSAEAAFLGFLAAALITITGTPWGRAVTAIEALPPIRPIPSLLALACCAAAIRMHRSRWLIAAGALAVIAMLTSIEFGVYAFVALIVSIRSREALRDAAIGTLAASAIAALAMLLAGFFGAFMRVMLFEIPSLTDAYTVAFFDFPAAHSYLRGFPDVLGGLFHPRTVWIILWFAIAVATAVMLTRRIHALLPLGAWVTVAALSFAERTNVYYMPVAMVFLVASVFLIRRTRAFVPAAIVVWIIVAPTASILRTAHRENLIHAGNVWLDRDNAVKLAAAQVFVKTLGPNETFFDFANMPILYFLFDKRCPVRQYETPFYETESLQREVIARLQRDASVRAALMQFPNRGDTSIDGIPSAVRAPIVFAWLRANFRPAYERDGVVFWVRK